jgi:outer membrane receptor protein involved in Fe transport
MPVDFIFRIGYFNISDYNARIYAYERDVLYAFSSQMFYDKGWRWMAMAKWDPSESVTLYLKFGQSIYPGEEKTGSGLNEINKAHRSEIKFESVIRF